MGDHADLEGWKSQASWRFPVDPTPFHIAACDALTFVRRGFTNGRVEGTLTDMFFDRLQERSEELDRDSAGCGQGPILDGLVFSASAAASNITERKLGADFAIAFWEPDGSLRLAIFQAKKLDTDKLNIDISQFHKKTQGRQALDLLSTGMRAPAATDSWSSVSWVHFVAWSPSAWERFRPFSDIGDRLARMAGIKGFSTDEPIYALPMTSRHGSFFELLCHGANQPVTGTERDLTHWLTLSAKELAGDSVIKEILDGLNTYFIYDHAREHIHLEMKKTWLTDNTAAPIPPASSGSSLVLKSESHIDHQLTIPANALADSEVVATNPDGRFFTSDDVSPAAVLHRAGKWAPEALVNARIQAIAAQKVQGEVRANGGVSGWRPPRM